jgi:hypothetical protein
MESYGLEEGEAEAIRDITDAGGIDEDDARMLYEEGIRAEDI